MALGRDSVCVAVMRKAFLGTSRDFPQIPAEPHAVDAMALDLVRRPWDLDVLPMETLSGDVLSDLGAGLVGGMGHAPSADIGDAHAMSQPSRGTGADIHGHGIATPTAMLLSAAMMLG